jgi:hypothetical protein
MDRLLHGGGDEEDQVKIRYVGKNGKPTKEAK